MEKKCVELNISVLNDVLKETGEFFDKNVEINSDYLPLNIDVLAVICNIRNHAKYPSSYNDCYPSATNKIIKLWEKTNIPIIQYKRVREKMIKLINDYKTAKRNVYRGKSVDLSFLGELFDITSCKCVKFHLLLDCKCPAKNKISDIGLAFLIDQKTERKFTLDNYEFTMVDDEIGAFDCNDNERGASSQHLQTPSPDRLLNVIPSSGSDSERDEENEHDDDPDYIPEIHSSVPNKIIAPGSLSELNFDSVFAEAVRYNISYSQASAIINRSLEMLGAITNKAKGLVISRSFVQKGIKRIGKKMTRKWNEENLKNKLQCFYFDGVKAKNAMMVEKNGILMQDNSVTYENIVIVQQPLDRYLGFIALKECNANAICNGIRVFFAENNISLQDLIAIGSDGTSTNTGADNGIISKFEAHLNRPFHWIICLLHLIDLILRAVVSLYYGDTIGPGKYFGKINRDLQECHTRPVVKFLKVTLENMPHCVQSFDLSRLNSDQKFLFELSQAVDFGNVTNNIANRKPGDLYDPRWTTLAIRMLRLYMSTVNPSIQLIGVVHFIQKVYVPCFFWIKCFPDWTEGPRHLHRILWFSRSLPKNAFKAIYDRVVYNSYFAHSENLLLSMITDSDVKIRRKGYELILKARLKNSAHDLVSNVRIFKKPAKLEVKHSDSVNIHEREIDHYSKLIDWNVTELLEPPFTINFTDEQLKFYMRSNDVIIDVPRIPSHSQATELCVQLVKNIIVKYPNKDVQEGRIKTKIFARSLNPQFKSKKQKKGEYQLYDENKSFVELGKI